MPGYTSLTRSKAILEVNAFAFDLQFTIDTKATSGKILKID